MRQALTDRPRVGNLVVPYMVDDAADPIDFKGVEYDHVVRCAKHRRCGVCGSKIRNGPIAFIGPDDARTCFADPWMHPDCAGVAMTQCPFLAGKRDWRDPEGRADPLLHTYSAGMVLFTARDGRAHRDAQQHWHFEAIGDLVRG